MQVLKSQTNTSLLDAFTNFYLMAYGAMKLACWRIEDTTFLTKNPAYFVLSQHLFWQIINVCYSKLYKKLKIAVKFK